jgi:hypothetical protein
VTLLSWPQGEATEDGAGDGEFARRQLNSDGVFNALRIGVVSAAGLVGVAPLPRLMRVILSPLELSEHADRNQTNSCNMESRGWSSSQSTLQASLFSLRATVRLDSL